MAVRREALEGHTDARVYRFPTHRAGRVRLAAARRRAVALGMVVVATAGLVLAGGPEGMASAGSRRSAPQEITLRPGQTLWELATRYVAEGTDPRAYVTALLELNGLETPPPAGTPLQLPR